MVFSKFKHFLYFSTTVYNKTNYLAHKKSKWNHTSCAAFKLVPTTLQITNKKTIYMPNTPK